jgi:hypothetical protein
MQRGRYVLKSQIRDTCIECAEQAILSCALCRAALCKRHQNKIQEEGKVGTTAIILCAACKPLSIATPIEELGSYIAWYNPGWALA